MSERSGQSVPVVLRAVFVAILAATVACAPGVAPPTEPPQQQDGELPIVLAANYPLAWIAERLVGDRARVAYPGPPDVDPAEWRPSREALRELQEADLVLLGAPGSAKWVGRASLAVGRVVDTTRGFRDRHLPAEGAVEHSHGPRGGARHSHFAVTTWLDPLLAVEQVRAAAEALGRLEGVDASATKARADALVEQLMALDAELAELADATRGRPLLASHPVYGYLARRLGWKLRSARLEPGVPPSEDDWRELYRLLEGFPATVMIWEGPPDASTAERLAERGIASVVVDPCAAASPDGDLFLTLRANVERLRAVLLDGE